MGGRVKTLHPTIHAGILARRQNSSDIEQMIARNIDLIDLVIVNLYPFEQTRSAGSDYDTCIENIDIGGPAMIRAGAKNHRSVTVIVEPEDYPILINELAENDGRTSHRFREQMAAKAFRRTAAYDAAIGSWFAEVQEQSFPERIILAGKLENQLRYGENPHQSAAFYSLARKIGWELVRQFNSRERN